MLKILSNKKPQDLHVIVIMGGKANERNVSLISGKAVAKALKEAHFKVTEIDISNDFLTTMIDIKKNNPDIIFNALHGHGGEDGAIQGVLEWLQIPYTHSNVLASAMAMNKNVTRRILNEAGLPIAPGKIISKNDLYKKDPLRRPYVIKPLEEGSSFGVFILNPHKDKEIETEERQTIAKEWAHGNEILCETFIAGRELTVSVLDDTALAVTEICSNQKESFYNYTAKYSDNGFLHILPAKLSENETKEFMNLAIRAHQALGCQGASRTDFRYDDQQQIITILEVNTQPGMTPKSLLPEQAQLRGLSYKDLCVWMVYKALDPQTKLRLK